MFQTKYYDGVHAAQAAQRPESALPAFDMERLRGHGLVARLVGGLLENPRPALKLLRRWKPVLVIGKFALVTKNADVREVLERQDVFHTPFGPEMAEMAGGSNFVLGMQDGAAYRRMKSAILSSFPPKEAETVVRALARRHSAEILRAALPGFDAVRDLLKPVPARICRDYFGMEVEDENAFADWSIALSSLFFADFTGSAATRELAVVAAARMRDAIDRSIARAEAGEADPATSLARLVAQAALPAAGIDRDDVRSIMMGMISGFAPTNLLAGGNCLDAILSMPQARSAVEAAIAAGDDAALDKAIMEAMRFKPINVGPLRYVAQDAVIARGTRRETTLKAGMTVMPSTLSAMFDEDAIVDPELFNPERSPRDSMVFGHGIHWCIGSAIARVQIAESLKALFSRPGLQRMAGPSGRLARRGAFPDRLCVDFDLPDASRTVEHAFVTIVAPARAGVSTARLREMVRGFGNPPAKEVADALDATGIVHFASLSVVTCADPEAEKPDDPCQIVLEFSADGTERDAIAAVADKAGALFRPIFAEACGLAPDAPLAAFLERHAVRVSPAIHSQTGLCFSGTPGHSVRRILAEERLNREVSALIAAQAGDTGRSALDRLDAMRAELAQRGFDWALQPAPHRLDGAERPTANAIRAIALEPANIAGAALAVSALALLYYLHAFGGYEPGVLRNIFAWVGSGVLGLLTFAVAAILAAAGAYGWFRSKESRDPERGEPLAPGRFAGIAALEDHMAHNHLAAISIVKPGLLRRVTLRLGLFSVRLFARHVFRPGHLADIGSIHFARWVLLPGTDRLMFFSNYGGSWESYLEDFITKAHKGLTGVWSNTENYPRTKNLFFDGATNGPLFKRWAREQQIPTLFWYSAYPKLTTGRIRRNAAIRSGLAGARTQAEARSWVDLFGSSPRSTGELEAPAIQSILFGGMGRLREAAMIAVAFPDGAARPALRRWLDHVAAGLAFGDREPTGQAMVAGFGGRGLMMLGLPDDAPLPPAFLHGMDAASQARVLGDSGHSAPQHWRWGSGRHAADAILILYADGADRLETGLAALQAQTAQSGLAIVARLPLTIETGPDGKPVEHFGYRDNISQPILAGTPRARSRTDAQHVLAAGEFLYGYPDETGRPPPAIAVAAASDRRGDLADAPDVGGRLRDFGRNGSFLVVRQLEQHVEAFDAFCAAAGEKLGGGAIAGKPAADWVGAKMLGRWKDGTSLVRQPEWREGRDADNAFLYADEDPQGRRCPYGAHIRRSNPRDTLGPDRQGQLRLSKRHRILRIGRTYRLEEGTGGAPERGMLFMCLNADIDRQFAFVQQTWVNNARFEGLDGERDPLVGNPEGGGRFTIPGPGGPTVLTDISSFVTVRGGGYFFMPGRQAIDYLRSRLA